MGGGYNIFSQLSQLFPCVEFARTGYTSPVGPAA
jgi:hypothetical protein